MRFADQPLAVRFAVGLTLFNSWILFAEVVVDRHGLWRYLPYYRVGDPCAWDIFIAMAIGACILAASRRRRRDAVPGSAAPDG